MKSIHRTAIIEGDVELGDDVYISAYAVIKGDEGKISIGSESNVQEHCTLHGSGITIGERVTIGHNSVIHGCRIGNNVLVGMGAIILDGAEIGDWCIIGAGALVPPGMKIETNSLVIGLPAKVFRKITDKDRQLIKESAGNYLAKLAKKPAEKERI